MLQTLPKATSASKTPALSGFVCFLLGKGEEESPPWAAFCFWGLLKLWPTEPFTRMKKIHPNPVSEWRFSSQMPLITPEQLSLDIIKTRLFPLLSPPFFFRLPQVKYFPQSYWTFLPISGWDFNQLVPPPPLQSNRWWRVAAVQRWHIQWCFLPYW